PSVLADSKTGSVSSSVAGLTANRGSNPQLEGRIGNGASSVRLYSQAGNIALENSSSNSARSVSRTPDRAVTLAPSDIPGPRQRPDLVGPQKPPQPAGTPEKVTNGPEEISEGDVIRVDTELVSVNVSVIDRGT